METYIVTGCPLLFPKLCCKLIDSGLEVRVLGKKRADYKLNEILVNYLINPNLDLIPDITYFDTKSKMWKDIFVKGQITLDLGSYGQVTYSPALLHAITNHGRGVVLDYLNLNSVAEVQVS